jgi:molybdopterin-guanine dinucleotide biosynthesis protein A
MGGPKAGLELDGRSLVAHAVDRVRNAGRRVMVVAAAGQDLGGVDAEALTDLWPDKGPLGGLATALSALRDELGSGVLGLVGVDMPCFSVALLDLLAGAMGSRSAAVPLSEGRLQPLHGVYHTRLLPHLAVALAEDRLSLVRTLESEGIDAVPEEAWRASCPLGDPFRNLNTQEDLQVFLEERRTSHA